ncbi:MAG: LAGLIDADG family homing endonuclease [Actinomycetota bacterium]
MILGCPPAHIGGTSLSQPNVTVRQYRGKAGTLKATQASYLAGFLDGDGSIHFQLVRQREYKFGFYIRASMSLSQSTSARSGLEQIHSMIGAGYIRDRGTGMSDLVITSRPVLQQILAEVEAFVIFKREHVKRARRLLGLIRPRMGEGEFLELAREVDAFATLNYSKSKRIFAADVEQHLRSKGVPVPVTTSSDRLSGEMEHLSIIDKSKLHNTPAPRKRVKV